VRRLSLMPRQRLGRETKRRNDKISRKRWIFAKKPRI